MPLLTTQSAKGYGFSALTAAEGDFEWIATGTTNTSSPSITFSSIPQTYKHLQIRGIGNASYGSNDYGALGIRFNSDTGTNYTRHGFRSNLGQSTPSHIALTGTTFASPTEGVFLNSTASDWMGTNVIDILDYTATDKYKTARGISGVVWTSSSGMVMFGAGMWKNTAAVTSITVYQQNANWGTGTSFALYGLKG
jgi:hypothetical protein